MTQDDWHRVEALIEAVWILQARRADKTGERGSAEDGISILGRVLSGVFDEQEPTWKQDTANSAVNVLVDYELTPEMRGLVEATRAGAHPATWLYENGYL